MGAWSDTLPVGGGSLEGVLEDGCHFQYRVLLLTTPDGPDPTLEYVEVNWDVTGIEEKPNPSQAPTCSRSLPIPPVTGDPLCTRSAAPAEIAVFDLAGRCVAGETAEPGEDVRLLLLEDLLLGLPRRLSAGEVSVSQRLVVVE